MQTIYDILELPQSKNHSIELIAALFFYLFGLIPRQQFVSYVGNHQLSKRLIKTALNNGYILKHCKLYAYADQVHGSKKYKKIQINDYEITRKDANILTRLNLSKVQQKIPAYTLSEYDRIISRLVGGSEFRNYANAFIYKKLTFLINSYGTTREDLFAQLQLLTSYALYKQFPRYESPLHMLNICKTTIHNQGLGLIGFHNKKKRKALMKTKDGFESVALPLEFAYDLSQEENLFQEQLYTLSQLENKMSSRVKTFLSILSGQYNKEFSNHIGMNNTDYVDKVSYDHYSKVVRNYMKISLKQQENLYKKLREYVL